MTHPDDERLASLVLEDAEPASEAERAHLADCATCRGVMEDLERVRALTAGAPSDQTWEVPPHSVWQGVAAEVGQEAAPGLRTRLAGVHRSWPLLVAAASLLVGIGIGRALAPEQTEPEPTPEPERIATARLDTLGNDHRRLGDAEVVRTDGDTRLWLELEDVEPGEGYLEVWLINEDLTRMVSVGVIGDAGMPVFSIPESILDDGYLIVDVSREGLDDDPAHSGDSVMRGKLKL